MEKADRIWRAFNIFFALAGIAISAHGLPIALATGDAPDENIFGIFFSMFWFWFWYVRRGWIIKPKSAAPPRS